MEIKRLEDYSQEDQKELKRFHKSFLLFFIGTIFMIVGTLSLSTNINGVPQILAFLSIFSSVGYVLLFFSLLLIYRFNRSFLYSFICEVIFLVLMVIVAISNTSTSLFYNALGRGLSWGTSFAQGVFYLYYFHGCMLFFQKHELSHGVKQFRLFIIIFAVVFILEEIFEYFSTAKFVLVNRFANRFFLYGHWGLIFLVYLIILIAVILTSKYINKQIDFKQKGKEQDNEQI